MSKRIHHVAVVVRDLEQALDFYRDTLGLAVHKVETLVGQDVKAALLDIENSEIELLEPLSTESGSSSSISLFSMSRSAAFTPCSTSVSTLRTGRPNVSR